MLSETELKTTGMRALMAALGDVDAEKFIMLMLREPFDYTLWQRTLWPEASIESISRMAMQHRKNAAE